eukprot:m.19122 g.19122  ORF g.19122 m.19122 type:complete len:73 (+) comp8414_c1_seq1:203-421(+)
MDKSERKNTETSECNGEDEAKNNSNNSKDDNEGEETLIRSGSFVKDRRSRASTHRTSAVVEEVIDSTNTQDK